jgi:uncharacterized YceG family protein
VGERGPYLRTRPSQARIWLRRVVAIAVLVGALLLGVWVAKASLDTVRDELRPPPRTVRPVSRPKPLRIVFPEGFTRAQMGQRIIAVNQIAKRKRNVTTRLSAQAYAVATRRRRPPNGFSDARGRTLEGFLFPATYDFDRRTTSKQLVDRQLDAFRRSWAKVDLDFARSKNLTPYDVLIIASMIEREVKVPRERALVAAVIYNRLKAGIPLGIDATLRYGLDIPPTQAIRESQLDDPTPYNTRIHSGLPPTPIGNPGLASMKAAARPANVDYLFFVRNRDCRTHFFTASEAEFLARVAAPRC